MDPLNNQVTLFNNQNQSQTLDKNKILQCVEKILMKAPDTSKGLSYTLLKEYLESVNKEINESLINCDDKIQIVMKKVLVHTAEVVKDLVTPLIKSQQFDETIYLEIYNTFHDKLAETMGEVKILLPKEKFIVIDFTPYLLQMYNEMTAITTYRGNITYFIGKNLKSLNNDPSRLPAYIIQEGEICKKQCQGNKKLLEDLDLTLDAAKIRQKHIWLKQNGQLPPNHKIETNEQFCEELLFELIKLEIHIIGIEKTVLNIGILKYEKVEIKNAAARTFVRGFLNKFKEYATEGSQSSGMLGNGMKEFGVKLITQTINSLFEEISDTYRTIKGFIQSTAAQAPDDFTVKLSSTFMGNIGQFINYMRGAIFPIYGQFQNPDGNKFLIIQDYFWEIVLKRIKLISPLLGDHFEKNFNQFQKMGVSSWNHLMWHDEGEWLTDYNIRVTGDKLVKKNGDSINFSIATLNEKTLEKQAEDIEALNEQMKNEKEALLKSTWSLLKNQLVDWKNSTDVRPQVFLINCIDHWNCLLSMNPKEPLFMMLDSRSFVSGKEEVQGMITKIFGKGPQVFSKAVKMQRGEDGSSCGDWVLFFLEKLSAHFKNNKETNKASLDQFMRDLLTNISAVNISAKRKEYGLLFNEMNVVQPSK